MPSHGFCWTQDSLHSHSTALYIVYQSKNVRSQIRHYRSTESPSHYLTSPQCSSSVFYNDEQEVVVFIMSHSQRLPPSGMNGSDVLAGRLAHGAESSSGAQDASTSTNFDDFDFDALGITTPHPLDGEDVSSPAARGVSFQPVPTHSRSSSRGSDDSGLNFLSTMKKTQVEMRLEKMRSARKNRFSSMSLQSEDSQRSIGSGPRVRRSFFQALSERTPLLVRILALRVMLHCLTM